MIRDEPDPESTHCLTAGVSAKVTSLSGCGVYLTQHTMQDVKAVLHRHIATSAQTGKLTYEKVELSAHPVSLAVSGDIVMVRTGGEAVAAAKLGEKDYITFEQEVAA